MAAKNSSKAGKAATRKTTKRAAPKGAPKKAARKAPASKDPASVPGAISHTEFISSDPVATKTWAQKTLGWTFPRATPIPGGEYHVWEGQLGQAGGMRTAMGPETPGTIVYVTVQDIQKAYASALEHGAKTMLPPTAIGGDRGIIAIVNAPGGVALGFWGKK